MYWVAGLPGAIVVLIAFFLPTAVLTFIIGRLWTRLGKWRWRTSIQRGPAPVSIGQLLAGCLTMAKEATTGSRLESPLSLLSSRSAAGQIQRFSFSAERGLVSWCCGLVASIYKALASGYYPVCDFE